ncbi:PIN domain-containing protein [Cyanobacterium stanieri LEGE 03274]|uniref:PIN domain-containing protein n=1 Tax=Cyanobacterium stanieri LEGE 03274 TaxID=1828756 RepID=A0ABR9V1M6_9CHRO|nr:PIN domain-containing protein [Cyanobacterium stanieri]MBE9221800.1 PIN domain-containing protein [Cyanobacterium stanieri LEGE 03274]
MYLIDTSILINIFRDKSNLLRTKLEGHIKDEAIFLTNFTQMELLQGAKNEKEWQLLKLYLSHQDYILATPDNFINSARIFYELRRKGFTVRSVIDCCIAQLALNYDLVLIHNDRDFETIKNVRPLKTFIFE